MIKKYAKLKKDRKGFTLIEVMVTLGLISIFVPGILMMQYTMNRMSNSGVNRDQAMSQARRFQQYFIRKVNASGRNIQVKDSGNTVTLELYNEATGSWEEESLSYLPGSKEIVSFPAGGAPPKSIANQVHRNGNNPIFEPKPNGVRCNLFIGKTPPNQAQDPARFVTPGIFVDLIATSRNVGSP